MSSIAVGAPVTQEPAPLKDLQLPPSPTPTGKLSLPPPLMDDDQAAAAAEPTADEGEATTESAHKPTNQHGRRRRRPGNEKQQPSPYFERLIECIRKGILVMITHAEHEAGPRAAADDVTPAHSLTVRFPPEGGQSTTPDSTPITTPPHHLHSTFQFKEYSPHGFRRLRERAGISQADYLLSMTTHEECFVFKANSNSGGTFFFTADRRYMVKTHSKSESKFLRRILHDYLEYMEANPGSLLVKLVGLYRLRLSPAKPPVHFLVMANVLRTDRPVWMTYDLKGSMVGRRSRGAPRYYDNDVRKDQDLLDDQVKIVLGDRKKPVCSQLRQDAEFLASKNIMDYSLLVAIVREPQQPQHAPPDYLFGIIDILQEYTVKKRAAKLVKSVLHDARQLSTVEPAYYASRFCAFLESVVSDDRRAHRRPGSGIQLQEDCPISI